MLAQLLSRMHRGMNYPEDNGRVSTQLIIYIPLWEITATYLSPSAVILAGFVVLLWGPI
jgi:dolichol kinase